MDSKEYSELGDFGYQQLLFAQYFAQKDTANYPVPILAEAPVGRFIKFHKFTSNFEKVIPNKMATTVFVQEYNRIQYAKARALELQKPDSTIAPIEAFDGYVKEDGT